MKTFRVYANHPISDRQDFVDVDADYYDISDAGLLCFTVEKTGPVKWFGPGGWFTFDEKGF